MAITPDGQTLYVVNEQQSGTVTPVNTATNTSHLQQPSAAVGHRSGKPEHVGSQNWPPASGREAHWNPKRADLDALSMLSQEGPPKVRQPSDRGTLSVDRAHPILILALPHARRGKATWRPPPSPGGSGPALGFQRGPVHPRCADSRP